MFVRGIPPIWFEFDLTGQIFDDRYYAFFLTNDLPYLPQAVYSNPQGTILWSNPIEFQANGGLPDNIFFDPDLVYRIEFREGPTQSDPLIGNPIENYVPSGNSVNPIVDSSLLSENLITNPQFADVYFDPESVLHLASAGLYDIAPGWQLLLTGTGTADVQRDEFSGTSIGSIPGTPPYALNIQTNGFTTAALIQTFTHNGAIFSNGAVTFNMLANVVGANEVITVDYEPSTSTSGTLNIFNNTIIAGSLAYYSGFKNLPQSTNTDDSDTAFVQIAINLVANGGNITISNVQLTGQSTPLPSTFTKEDVPDFQETTYERIVDHEFHLYREPLSYKPIPSYLVGWDFASNPAQFFGTSVPVQAVGANKSYYAWDQTIIFQSVNSGAAITQDAGGAFQLTCAVAGQFAIIQYVPSFICNKILNDIISVNLAAVSSKAGGLPVTISLWYTTSSGLPSTVASNNSLVLTLDANGKPATFNTPGTWVEAPPLNGQEASPTVLASPTTTNYNDYDFNGYWNLDGIAAVDTANWVAIVIGTSPMAIGDTLHVSSVGLCSGSIATRPAPLSDDEVIRECQYYYEKSYNIGVAPGTSTSAGEQVISLPQNSDVNGNVYVYPKTIFLRFKQIKIVAPTAVTFWTPTGTINNVSGQVVTSTGTSQVSPTNIPISHWNLQTISPDSAWYSVNSSNVALLPSTGATLGNFEGLLNFHYVVDTRIGL